MTVYRISPIDTLFFRDGRPYNQGESNQTDVASMFPPTPYTIVGALRAAVARNMGWNGKDRWNQNIISELGDGPDLGKLKFNGPYIMGDETLFFPVPRHLLGKKQKSGDDIIWSDITALAPGKEVNSDMGKVKFPVQPNKEKMKNVDGYLIAPDMQKVLNGDVSDIKPVQKKHVWAHEFSVGISRDENKNVGEGGLFSRRFVRLAERQEKNSMDISIVMEMKGIDRTLSGPLILGGESKAAFVEEAKLELPSLPEDTEKLKRYMAILVTPAYLGVLEANKSVEGLPGKLVSVCVERPQMIGGWDSDSGPQPLKPYMKAGSVLFFECEEGMRPGNYNGLKIGERTEFGFGQILIGKYKER